MFKIAQNEYERIYIFAFCLWYSTEILFSTSLKSWFGVPVATLNTVIVYTTLLIGLFLFVCGQRYSLQNIIILAVVSALILVSINASGRLMFACAWLFIADAKNIRLNRVVKAAYISMLITLLVCFILFFFGITEETTYLRNGIIRHSFGVGGHPNQLGLRLFQLIVCHVYLRWKRIHVFDFLFVALATGFTYIVTNSQTATISLVILMILILFFKVTERYLPSLVDKVSALNFFVSIFCCIGTISLTVNGTGNNQILIAINQFLSARFSWAHLTYLEYGYSIFGQKNIYITQEERIAHNLTGRLWLDSAHGNLLIIYGIVTMVLVLGGYFMAYYKLRKIPIMCIIFFLYSIYGVMEFGMVNLTHNVFLLAIAWVLYPNKPLEDIEPEEPSSKKNIQISRGKRPGIMRRVKIVR